MLSPSLCGNIEAEGGDSVDIVAMIMVFIMALTLSFSVLFACAFSFPLAIIVFFFKRSDRSDNIIEKYIRIALAASAFLSPILAIVLIKFDLF